MTGPRKLLIIDHNPDSRFLLVKTLMRRFPKSIIHECQDAETAVAFIRTERVDAIISHRTTEVDVPSLVRLLRSANKHVPIVVVSGVDRSAEVVAAGATRFVNYDQWGKIGSVVDELLTPVAQ